MENNLNRKDLEEELKILLEMARSKSLKEAENFLLCVLSQVWIKNILRNNYEKK
jgi:hypothetical protein